MKDLTGKEISLIAVALDALRSRNDGYINAFSSSSSSVAVAVQHFTEQNVDIECLLKKVIQ